MRISKQWLSDFVKMPEGVSDQDLAKTVTLSTVEVEDVVDQAAAMSRMVVGLVTSVEAHPNADRLRVCQVDVGERETQIVCGGTNVAAGMKVAVALPGSRVRWHGKGDLVEIEKAKLRGVESDGMICAGVEIGIEKSDEGEHEIMDLSRLPDAPGTPLGRALGRDDVVFEIEHKSLTNRPDLMGHYGMAREIAALYRLPLAPYAPEPIKDGKGTDLSVRVEDADRCPRYMAVAVDGVAVGPSPEWMRNRLLSCGVRSINNVVDVTNYVMLELGQPMHAFDADVLGGKIVVRRARDGEKIECLDEESYELDGNDLLITDGTKPLAIAGVMGGMGSGVGASTTRVVFESANFNPVSVRKTSTRLALRSESSARFEKSLDPEQCAAALARAVELLRQTCSSARVTSPVVDEYPNPPKPVVVSLAVTEVNGSLGTEIPADAARDILTRLGFAVRGDGGELSVTVPPWRATKDISIKEDVVEEVARIWGYDRIPSSLPSFSIVPPPQDPVRPLARRLRRALAAGGFAEAYRYAFVSPETLRALGFDPDDHLALANPLAADRPYLVRSLVPNLVEAVAGNERAFPVVALFEIDRVFLREAGGDEDGQGGTLPAQPYRLAVAYAAVGDERPFAALRASVERALSAEGMGVAFAPSERPEGYAHPARSADILVGGTPCGTLCELSPEAADAFGIGRRVAVAELDLSRAAALPRARATFAAIPQFPDVKRDLAVVVGEDASYGDMEAAIRGASPLVAGVELFDVYRGKGMEEGKKSVAVHLALRSGDRTLSSEDADQAVAAAVDVLRSRFGAMIRA